MSGRVIALCGGVGGAKLALGLARVLEPGRLVLLVNTGDGPIHRNKTMICVPMKTNGVTVARTLKKLGMHASDTAQIHFDDVRVPQRFRIGEEGLGFTYQMVQFQEERMYAALGALTGMQRTIDETIAAVRCPMGPNESAWPRCDRACRPRARRSR